MRSFLRALAGSFIATFALLVLLVNAREWIGAQSGPVPRQDRAGFAVVLQTGIGDTQTISIDAEGEACDELSAVPRWVETCRLATYLAPTLIAGAAMGRLNHEDTPSFLAIRWRATLGSDPGFCLRSGLLGDRLLTCQRDAERRTSADMEGSWSVRVDTALEP